MVEETLWVRLLLPGAVVKFSLQQLRLASEYFVVLTESSMMVIYQVNVDLLSTNIFMRIEMRLIHVNP